MICLMYCDVCDKPVHVSLERFCERLLHLAHSAIEMRSTFYMALLKIFCQWACSSSRCSCAFNRRLHGTVCRKIEPRHCALDKNSRHKLIWTNVVISRHNYCLKSAIRIQKLCFFSDGTISLAERFGVPFQNIHWVCDLDWDSFVRCAKTQHLFETHYISVRWLHLWR